MTPQDIMTPQVSRRGLLAASATLAATSALPRFAFAGAAPLALTATTRTIEVDGRAATVYGLLNAAGKSGLILDPGERFRVDLTNALDVETLVHWHGQIPPNAQDGVPDMPMPKLRPGESRAYDFAPEAGTYWMHSHIAVQEMRMLAAPLIVRSAADVKADRQDVTMFLHDFSFKTSEEVLAEITGGAVGSDGMTAMGNTSGGMGQMSGMSGMGDMPGMSGMAMDLNDYNFDAYLANDRTLSDPEVVRIEKGGRIRLRVVNAAAATTFWIATGVLPGRLVAVDGRDVLPIAGSRFGVSMAHRLDIELDLPAGDGSYPILAHREGARERTGLILASAGAKMQKIAGLAETEAPAFDMDLAQESRLRAANPLAARPVDQTEMVMLSGAMQPYVWTIDGQTWEHHIPVTARSGQRVELTFHNMSMMAHPMHLHGHAFQVVAIGGQRFAGALRDTVLVPPMAAVTVALDAGDAARWMLHCHHIPHMASGMMTEFAVSV
jgi:FtsP/CotA-like multicopper oxidase with cupredoxin domain